MTATPNTQTVRLTPAGQVPADDLLAEPGRESAWVLNPLRSTRLEEIVRHLRDQSDASLPKRTRPQPPREPYVFD